MTVSHIARTTATFRDLRGMTALHTFHVDFNDGGDRYTRAANIFFLLGPITHCNIARAMGAYTTPGGDIHYGASGLYGTVQDKLEAVFLMADGSQVKWRIPGPPRSLFLSDGTTADPGNADLSAWAQGVIDNHGCGAHGGLIVRFVGGRLVRSTKPSRLTSYTLRPDLQGPDW